MAELSLPRSHGTCDAPGTEGTRLQHLPRGTGASQTYEDTHTNRMREKNHTAVLVQPENTWQEFKLSANSQQTGNEEAFRNPTKARAQMGSTG